ncbi:hypothetical protein IFM89_034620 [Coptis chinensis]|uniref:RanBP2-type domain-containing protein n=1 Tax=Coptis chinensis TaxID=261450 RepID=A0A835LWB8_9MAGN|nr:hypothetical protein IFM89_034620 [Coptis chinensis]
MSFVFEQMDVLGKERSNNDDALQRIRAWKETKKKRNENECEKLEEEKGVKKNQSLFKKEVELVHPWPEWVELMERLVQQTYFDHRRRDEDKIVKDLDIDVTDFPFEEGYDISRDWTAVRTAVLNFGRDRFDILRSLSRQDIQILVGHGCPSTDKKVVFSGKMLRKHVHLDEGDVCSSCNLRSSCEKAYLLARKEDETRTLDVMRILLAYGFDPVGRSVENKSLLKLKSVKTVVRKLLHEVVKLSAVPIDPNLPPPVIRKPPPKVKQPPPTPRKRVGRDDVEMKKGDWLCPKCDFMNFAKNTVCLQCDAKRPKRQLLPGEWECPECNFLNYRRNMACFHCDHKRPPDAFMESQMQERHVGPRTKSERVTDVPEGSNAWNFDFDDNESDGADVAAFEYADSPRTAEDSPIENNTEFGNSRGFEDDSETRRTLRSNGKGRYSDLDQKKSGTGFDDFDDEEDDDIDSYELETPNNNSMHKASKDFSRGRRTSRPVQRKEFSGSEDDLNDLDSDEEPSVHSGWKSSHVGDSRNGIRGRGRSGSYKGKKFGSDRELDFGSDSDGDIDRGIGSNHSKSNKLSSNKRGFRRGGDSGSEDGLAFGSESDDDTLHSSRNKFRGNGAGPSRGRNSFRSHGQFESARNEEFRPNVRMSDRGNSFGNNHGRTFRGSQRNNRESSGDGYGGRRNSYGNTDFGRPSPGSYRNNRESNGDGYGYGGRRPNDRDNMQNSGRDRRGGGLGWDNMQDSGRGRRGEGIGYQKNRGSNGFNDRSEMRRDFSDDRPRRRIIER